MWVKAAARRALQDVSKVKPKAPGSQLVCRANTPRVRPRGARSLFQIEIDPLRLKNMTVKSARLETSHPSIVQRAHRCRCSLEPRSLPRSSVFLLFPCFAYALLLISCFVSPARRFVISWRISASRQLLVLLVYPRVSLIIR